MAVKSKIQELLLQLNDGVYEKKEVIALALLSSVAGESIFLLGAPGVAKSLIARRLKYAYDNGKSFEYLMSRFSTPDEIFGPVSISKLKDEDKYERNIDNYLPSATVVFLDEIWKAGSSIQNALLTVLNEKKYRNGEKEIDVPMKALISASNELPSKGEGLEALWDRFLVRLVVENIQGKQNFNDMISKPLNSSEDTVDDILKITDEEYEEWSKAIDEIEIPENVFNVIDVIRNYIDEHNKKEDNKEKQIYISDRRWRKIVRLLRTSAFLNDRTAVDLMDCFLIKHCIWNETEQSNTVFQFVKDAIREHGYKLSLDLSDIRIALKEFDDDVKTETSFIKPVKYTIPKKYTIQKKDYYKVLIKGAFKYDVDDLIEKEVIDNLKSDKYIETIRRREDMGDQDPIWINKSSKKNKIFLSNSNDNGKEYDFECTSTTKYERFSKKPHGSVLKEWEKQVAKILTKTGNLRSQIDHYKSEDLKHIRFNLFVDKNLAEIVENNLNDLEKEIGTLEMEVNSIKNYYEKVEDQTDSKEIKSLENE
ncbi:ATPase ravA [Bacteroidales bacterium Barb6]|nr:ATPase ravA [Bacteroidales bacterium Barb6]